MRRSQRTGKRQGGIGRSCASGARSVFTAGFQPAVRLLQQVVTWIVTRRCSLYNESDSLLSFL
jgi:hypothetical protein